MSKRKRTRQVSWIPVQQKPKARLIKPFDNGEIHIRPLNIEDAFEHKRLCDTSAEYLKQYLGFAENVEKWQLGHHRRYLNLNNSDNYPFEAYGAFYGKTLVGCFSYGQAGDVLGVQICYYVAKECAGRGIASEVTQVLIDKAFAIAGFEYVELHIDVKNSASQKVAQKLGFEAVKTYEHEKMGKSGSGKMQLWIKVNPDNKHNISLDNFRNDEYDYLVPVYKNIETFLNASAEMKVIADKIRRAQKALAGEIPLSEVQDILNSHSGHHG